jgi:MoaA/NifB/PqqE/SkfB family radical SAM enzyme
LKTQEVFNAWGEILKGRKPALSIEITRECPLRCPGCYAYDDNHVSTGVDLRQLLDKKGDSLVRGVLEVVDHYRPLHLSIVGGDPLVRFRELTVLLPLLEQRGIYVQVVTSAFRELPQQWTSFRRLTIVVSIDGLQPEHDARRQPATYARILKNISGHQVTAHCTITANMMRRPGYLEEFLQFWSARQEISRVWMSIFTPQKGASSPEILSPTQRAQAVKELLLLRRNYPKLDMAEGLIKEFLTPPSSPAECIFAQTTRIISADLKSQVVPCQFGGDPDCSQCGCIASMGLAALGHHKVGAGLTAGRLFKASFVLGTLIKRLERAA